jgi:hypothetical protein
MTFMSLSTFNYAWDGIDLCPTLIILILMLLIFDLASAFYLGFGWHITSRLCVMDNGR